MIRTTMIRWAQSRNYQRTALALYSARLQRRIQVRNYLRKIMETFPSSVWILYIILGVTAICCVAYGLCYFLVMGLFKLLGF